jgi:hypothetical protein
VLNYCTITKDPIVFQGPAAAAMGDALINASRAPDGGDGLVIHVAALWICVAYAQASFSFSLLS